MFKRGDVVEFTLQEVDTKVRVRAEIVALDPLTSIPAWLDVRILCSTLEPSSKYRLYTKDQKLELIIV